MHQFASIKRIIVYIVFFLPLTIGCNFNDIRDQQPPPSQKPVHAWTRLFLEYNVNLRDVYFLGINYGWTVGNFEAIFSTSSGTNWELTPESVSDESIYRSVYFINESTGWIVGDYHNGMNGGQIAISKNGGAYPEQQIITEFPLNAVCFSGSKNGWAGGERGLILHTLDAGENWTAGNIGSTDTIYDIQVTEAFKGWAVTSPGGIYRTYDGVSWHQEEIDIAGDLYAVHFTDTLNGWACGSGNTVLHRTILDDQTIGWENVVVTPDYPNLRWIDIFFTDTAHGWIIGDLQSVYKTADGGITWVRETTDQAGKFSAIFMITNSKGYIVGENGTILTYTPNF